MDIEKELKKTHFTDKKLLNEVSVEIIGLETKLAELCRKRNFHLKKFGYARDLLKEDYNTFWNGSEWVDYKE